MSNKLKKTISIIAFVFLGVFFSRCQKDDDDAELSSTSIDAVSAKNWLEKSSVNLDVLKYTKKIDWDNAVLINEEKEKAIEVPLLLEDNVMTNVVEDQDYKTHMRLLFIKDAEGYKVFDISYATKDATFDNNNKSFNLRNIGSEYSGYITIQNNTNRVVFSGKYENGKLSGLHNYKPQDPNIPTTERFVCTYYVIVGPTSTCSNWAWVPDNGPSPGSLPPGYMPGVPSASFPYGFRADPCSTAQKITINGKSAAYLSAKNAILNQIDGLEHSITLGKDANGNITQAPMNIGENGVQVKVNTSWPGAFAAIHDHPNSTPVSAGDIYAAAKLAKINSNFTTSFVLIKGETYTISVTDITAANAFVAVHPADLKAGYSPEFPDDVFNKMVEAGNRIGLSNDARTKAIASVLDKYNSGITLMKQDNNGNFYPLKTTTTGSLIPCN